MILCLLSAAIGLGVACFTFPAIQRRIGFGIPGGSGNAASGSCSPLALALVIGLPPAMRGMRLSIVDALAGR